MDITFVLCPNMIGLLSLSVLLVFTRFNYYLEKDKLKLFVLAAIVNVLIIAFEVVDYVLGNMSFESAYLFRRFTSATGFALSPVFPLLLARVARKNRFSHWVYLPAAVNVVLSYGSMFTGHVFLIDSYNSYYRGPLFMVMIAISVLYIILLIHISFQNLKAVHFSESGFLIGIVIVVIAGNLLEIAFDFHFILWNSCAVLLIGYYLYLHIQYFKYDPLTNAFNRNMFSKELSIMKDRENTGIISFDLDNLKTVNDKKGHEEGDIYLVKAAQTIEQCFSDKGNLYRIGGDEFVVIMADTEEEIMRENIAAFHDKCLQNDISVSCGYSFNISSPDPSQMLRDADKAMYENKRDKQVNR